MPSSTRAFRNERHSAGKRSQARPIFSTAGREIGYFLKSRNGAITTPFTKRQKPIPPTTTGFNSVETNPMRSYMIVRKTTDITPTNF